MKLSLAILFLLIARLSGFGEMPPDLSVSNRVHVADFVAIISITNAVTKTYGDGVHPVIGTNRMGFGTVELMLKGSHIPRPFIVRQNISNPELNWKQLEKGRFLIFGMYSGVSVCPFGFYGLAPIIGAGSDTNMVLWPNTNSVAEAVAEIQKVLKKGPPMMTFASWVEIINTGSPEARLQASDRLYQAFGRISNPTPEDIELMSGVARLMSEVQRGETTPEGFALYCKTVESLIADYAAARAAAPKAQYYPFRFAVHSLAGNPYRKYEDWEPVKNDLRAKQKWSTQAR